MTTEISALPDDFETAVQSWPALILPEIELFLNLHFVHFSLWFISFGFVGLKWKLNVYNIYVFSTFFRIWCHTVLRFAWYCDF